MNNIKTISNYLLNRKSCPKCFKNNLGIYPSPGRLLLFDKLIYASHVNMNQNYMSTAYIPYEHKNRLYRSRHKTIKHISRESYDMVEMVCMNCYYEFDVVLGNSVEK